jgi:hypothetical protein
MSGGNRPPAVSERQFIAEQPARRMPAIQVRNFLCGIMKTKRGLRCYLFGGVTDSVGVGAMRTLIAILTAAVIGLAFTPSDVSARPQGGGFRAGGFHGGFHGGGFRGFHGGFRHHGFRGFGAPVAVGLGLGLAAGYPYWGGYPYYADGCLAPRRIWTPYGWRVRWVNVCW